MMKCLHSILEARNHLFATYHGHHINKLDIKQFIYDSCLLYNPVSLGIVRLQTDHTLFLAESKFAAKEEKGIRNTRLISKNRKHLYIKKFIKFNKGIIQLTT